MNLIRYAIAAEDSVAKTVADKFNFDLSTIFYWAIGVGGLFALGAIIFGGLMYSTSGIVDKQKEAKEWIFGALKGLALLGIAFWVLSKINPEILKF